MLRLPVWVLLLGFAGLAPFAAGPLCVLLGVGTIGPGLPVDEVWRSYVTLVAVFLAGTFWGFALVAINGPGGVVGVAVASALMVATWVITLLPLRPALVAFAIVFLLLLLADYWRERTLDTIPGYFTLRSVLTAGALLAIALRLALP